MPLSEKNLSATPSDALEQLVPITPTICGSDPRGCSPFWPPSAEQPSVSFTSLTGCPSSWPSVPSKVPSR
jgi:hypothetical protein